MAAAVLAVVAGAQPATAAPRAVTPAASIADVSGFGAGNAAIASVDLAGSWSFTPAAGTTHTIGVDVKGRGFNPVAAIDLPYWSASGASDSNGTFPVAVGGRQLPIRQHGHPQRHRVQRRPLQHLGRVLLVRAAGPAPTAR